MIYYAQDNIVVRNSTKQDAEYLAKHMRQSDKDEIMASHGHTPEEAMNESMEHSILSFTVEKEGNPVVMFGVTPESGLLSQSGVIWMLATDGIDTIKRRFAKHSRKFINMMMEVYPKLSNYVDCRNVKSICWLKWCRASFGEPVVYGVGGLDFIPFKFER